MGRGCLRLAQLFLEAQHAVASCRALRFGLGLA